MEHCAEKGIPIDEGVGVVDTDFTSEPHSNISDSDSDFWEDLEERQVKAGVAAKAWVTIGLAWRSPDVSYCGTYEMLLTSTLQYVIVALQVRIEDVLEV